MQTYNRKSGIQARDRKDLDSANCTQAEFIARQLLLEREIDRARKCGTRAEPTIRKFSWES